MLRLTTIEEMRDFSRRTRAGGRSLALVPTMGALHEGHLSLVQQAKSQCDVVVVSIFVNPAQFGPHEDLSRYPRDLDRDLKLLQPLGVEAVFAPAPEVMYPNGFETFVVPGETSVNLEGAARPDHFRGVATVVLKLLNIVRPDAAYFGQKDCQQARVIRGMVEDLNLDTRLVICPLVRERDGLAMSSRNAYLSAEERQAATILYRSLQRAEQSAHAGETKAVILLEEMRQIFAAEPRAVLDYAVIVDPMKLRPVERVTSGCAALVAARVGSTRLIDNLIFGPPGAKPEMLLQLALISRPIAATRAHIPGLEVDVLETKVENCRDCAALAAIRLPPTEFLAKYLKRDYPDLSVVRTAVIGRDAPLRGPNFLYHSPDERNRFVTAIYDLVGAKNFEDFKSRFVLTDAIRCHSTAPHVPEKALAYCAKFLPEELRLFPQLDTLVLVGEDAYLQFQRVLLGRSPSETLPFGTLLREKGWAQETARVPSVSERELRVFCCHHPTLEYKRSPSLASFLR